MKKAISCLLVLTLPAAFLLSGCGAPEQTDDQNDIGIVSVPNPIVEAEDASALAELGLPIDAPGGAANVRYSIIGGEIAQVNFTLDGAEYTYRAARSEEDISGVYETFDDIEQGIEADGEDWCASITVKTVKDGGGALAGWRFDPVQFSLYTPDDISADAMGAVATRLAEQSYRSFVD